METFCQVHNFNNLLDKAKCYKNPINLSCVDLIIMNKSRSFENSCTFETGLSDFQKMVLTVLKSSFSKKKPSVLNYNNYKFFNNTLFRDKVLYKLRNSNLQISDKDLKHSGTFYEWENLTRCYGQVKTKHKIP